MEQSRIVIIVRYLNDIKTISKDISDELGRVFKDGLVKTKINRDCGLIETPLHYITVEPYRQPEMFLGRRMNLIVFKDCTPQVYEYENVYSANLSIGGFLISYEDFMLHHGISRGIFKYDIMTNYRYYLNAQRTLLHRIGLEDVDKYKFV